VAWPPGKKSPIEIPAPGYALFLRFSCIFSTQNAKSEAKTA